MAFTVGEAVRLEQSLLTDGAAEAADTDSLIEQASAWFANEQSRGRTTLDSETFAFLCETIRFPRDATVGALAAGALRVVQRDGASYPHRAGFAARFAAKRIRALCGTVPLWSAIPLSPTEQSDAQALFEAAQGDHSYSDDELTAAVASLVMRCGNESTLFGRLAADLSRLVGIVRDPQALPHVRDVARAALTYFAVADDAIPDPHGFLGLLDDAYIVQRAVAEVCPERGAIVSLLDDLVRQAPFVRDVVFDVGDRTYPLSEFALVNVGLLLDEKSSGRGVALVVSSIGTLPVAVGFVRALAEVNRHLNREGWPEFDAGEPLVNPESGVGVLFEAYGRLTDKVFNPCPAAEATHVCFFVRPAGRDKSRSAYSVKRFRPVEDIVSFRRASPQTKAHGGSAVFDRDNLRLGVMERLFGSPKPIVLPSNRQRVVVVSPLRQARQTLEELKIFQSSALDILPTGQAQITHAGVEYRAWTKTNDGYGPILTFVRSTADAAVLCDDPSGRVAAVVAPVRADSSDAVNLTRISGRGVKVLAAVEHRHADGIEHLERAGFDCWVWDATTLSTVYWPHTQGPRNRFLSYETRLRDQVNAQIVTSHLALPGLSAAHSALRKLQALSAEIDSELLDLLLGEGFGLLLCLCRLASPVNGLSRMLDTRLRSFAASVDRGVTWWSDEIVDVAKTIPDEFARAINALGGRNPKLDALVEWVASNPNGQIVCGRSVRESLRTHLGAPGVCLVDRPDPTGAAVLVPAWLQRERMSRLLFPPVTRDLTLLLYDPEVDWHRAAERRYKQALDRARTFAAARPAFQSVRSERPKSFAEVDGALSFDPDDVVTEVRRARALKYLRSVGGETVRARLVQFVGGYWAAFSELHRVHTVTHLRGSDRRGDEEIRETVASELRAGDFVLLLRGTDRDALREEVDAVAPAGTREAAASWQGALRRYVACHPVQELVAKLSSAGCQRTLATVERWLEDESMIGPRSIDDVHAILAVTRDADLKRAMTSTLEAISQLRGLHVRMAHVLADRVLDSARQWLDAGAVPDELIEVEARLVLAVVESIDGNLIEVPRSIVNRLQEDK